VALRALANLREVPWLATLSGWMRGGGFKLSVSRGLFTGFRTIFHARWFAAKHPAMPVINCGPGCPCSGRRFEIQGKVARGIGRMAPSGCSSPCRVMAFIPMRGEADPRSLRRKRAAFHWPQAQLWAWLLRMTPLAKACLLRQDHVDAVCRFRVGRRFAGEGL
jgi:hypothetical protein